MSQLTINAHEHGQIRVFAINLSPPDVTDALKKHPKADLARLWLNAPHLNTASTEIFAVSDLTGMGLSGYLTEGHAAQEAQIGPDRTRLDAVDGFVLLLFSDSFAGAASRLTPSADLTLIGTYCEIEPASDGAAILAASAKPYSGAPAIPASRPKRGPGASAMVVIALMVAVALTLWGVLA